MEQEENPLAPYSKLIEDCVNKPSETYFYVPFQAEPNLPGFKINTIEIDGRTLWHGLSAPSAKKGTSSCIPLFTDKEVVMPSYAKHFELIKLPMDKIVSLITDDSSAQGFMLNMFTLNAFFDRQFVDMIKESIEEKNS